MSLHFSEKLELWNTVFERTGLVRPIFKREYVLKNGLLIKNNKRFITRKVDKSKVISFDCETYKGKCKLIALSTNELSKAKYLLNPSFDDCLKFLMYNNSDSNYYRFFYNIDFDISSILKIWNNTKSIKLLLKGITVKYKDYKITWLKSRMFILRKNKKTVYFTDLFNFFKIGLQKASNEFIGNIEKDNINGNLLNTSKRYWKQNLNEIIKYCKKDCYITSKLGLKLVNTIKKAGIYLPNYLVSSASLSKSDFRFHCYIDNISEIPEQILQISYDCYYGGRFEIFKRGFFNESYLYDINSQYPSFIRKLPNMKYSCFERINCKNYKLPDKETFGYFKVRLQIPDDFLIPTIPFKHNGVIKFPNGYIEKWCTWYDLDLVRDFIIDFLDGYILIIDNNPNKPHRSYKPFEKRIDFHYANKSKYKKTNQDFLYKLSKLTMNALYGCFIEQHKNYSDLEKYSLKSGKLFNPFYASQITAFGRWSVIKEVKRKHWKYIIAIHTDSIMSQIPLNYLEISEKIGKWNLEKSGKTIVLNTGMYQIADMVKTRGIPKKEIGNWLKFCLKNKNLSIKKFEIRHMKKISETLIQDKNLDKVNTIGFVKKSVNINSDTKRDWFSQFKNFKDVISRNIDSLSYTCISDNFNDFTLHPNYIVSQMIIE